MATDWPGHAQSNHNVHRPTTCDCNQYFTANQEPPWVYLFPALLTQDISQLDFLESSRYLTARTVDPVCRWEWNNIEEVDPAFKQIFVRPELTASGTAWHNVLYVAYTEITVFYEYKLLPDESFDIGTRIARGYVWTYNLNSWEKLADSPVPDWGPPIGQGNLTPQDCIEDWTWGEPIPNP